MIENFEFSDVKSVRKTLLIFSVLGLFLTAIRKFTTGNIEFIGFSIPVDEMHIILVFIDLMLLFFLYAFWVRVKDDAFKELMKEYNSLGSSQPDEKYLKLQADIEETLSKYRSIEDNLSPALKNEFSEFINQYNSANSNRERLKEKLDEFSPINNVKALDILIPRIIGATSVFIITIVILMDIFT